VDQPDAQGPGRVETPTTREQGARLRLADLGDDERGDDRRQETQPGFGEAEPRAGLRDDEVRHRTQAHAAAERGALDPGDDRHGAAVDGIEHLGHRHRVGLVGFAVEAERGPHPGRVGARAEAPALARQDDGAQLIRRLAGEPFEGAPEGLDRRPVEGVVDVRPVEADAGEDAVRPGALDP
jgi:hypothetical protein